MAGAFFLEKVSMWNLVGKANDRMDSSLSLVLARNSH